MRTYGLTMIPTSDSIVPVLLPFYTAESQNSLERGSRPYSVVEILREVFKEDFQKAIQSYMEKCPEGAEKAIGVDEARNFRLVWLSEPRVESSLHQPACTTAVDLIFKATVEAMVPAGPEDWIEVDGERKERVVLVSRRYTAEYRMRYLIGLWDKRCSAPMIAPAAYFPSDVVTEQKTAVTNQYLLPIMYAEDYAKAGRRMLERYYPEENVFRQLRLDQWVGSSVAWIPEHIYDQGDIPIDIDHLKSRECYCGLDLSSTSDITAFVMVFPPLYEGDKYIVVPHFWLPRETLDLRVRRDHVPYDVWEKQGLFHVTEGNVVDYNFVRKTINDLNKEFNIKEIGVDRWNATQLITDLEGDGFTMVPIGMGFKDMSPGMKELYKLLLEGKIIHGGNPVLRWMAGKVVAEIDAAENIKPSKKKSTEKIDGIVAWIMGLDRAIRHEQQGSVYDDPEHGLWVF